VKLENLEINKEKDIKKNKGNILRVIYFMSFVHYIYYV